MSRREISKWYRTSTTEDGETVYVREEGKGAVVVFKEGSGWGAMYLPFGFDGVIGGGYWLEVDPSTLASAKADAIEGAFAEQYFNAERNPSKDPEIAATILQQLGGSGRLSAMLGAKNFADHGNGLSFKFGKGGTDGINYIKITLDPSDTYTVNFGRVYGYKFTDKGSVSGVYNDQLRGTIEGNIGMYLSLGTMGR